MAPTVFISHSHKNRETATTIDDVLRDYGVVTFLDQEDFRAGERLSQRILSGIETCSVLLLLWSRDAAQSTWVTQEWQTALARGKRVLPYSVDKTPYPAALSDLLYVTVEDLQRGNRELLRGVFYPGQPPEPLVPRLEIVPGRWRLEAASGGVTAEFLFELRANGQLTGQANFWMISVAVTGEWAYDFSTRIFTARTIGTLAGQREESDIKLWITRRVGNVFYGHGQALQEFTLERLE